MLLAKPNICIKIFYAAIKKTYKIVRYIKNQLVLGILISNRKVKNIQAYCNTKKFMTDLLVVKHGDNLIVCKSKKQSIDFRILGETECRSMTTTVFEIVWIITPFKELDEEIILQLNLYCNSKATFADSC